MTDDQVNHCITKTETKTNDQDSEGLLGDNRGAAMSKVNLVV